MYTAQSLTLGSYIRGFALAVLIGVVIFYVHFQARNIISGPKITLTDTYTPIQHDRHITLTGTAQNVTKLTVNGKEIHTDESGVFNHVIILENGYTRTTIEAYDRFGHTTKIVRPYVYIP